MVGDTYKIIKKVDENFVCSGQVTQYFITSHGSFPEYLAKIGKRVNDLCTCGKVGDVHHYIFGRCPNMPYFFHFDNSSTVSQNFRRVLLNKDNYKKLCSNYNELNKLFSFINTSFNCRIWNVVGTFYQICYMSDEIISLILILSVLQFSCFSDYLHDTSVFNMP